MNTRVYDDIVDINQESVRSFWDGRALTQNSLKSVLLGNKFPADSADIRNRRELSLLIEYFQKEKKDLLDLGCGCGRWANNLKDYLKSYVGIDFSSEFIKNDIKNFSQYKNFEFVNASITSIPSDILARNFDFVIITGVLMYLNDNDLMGFFQNLKALNPEYIYLQESVSIMDVRLTLSNFYSDELNENYNAIYRKRDDYEFYISSILNNYKVIKQGLLLDEHTGAREETNAGYWLCKRV